MRCENFDRHWRWLRRVASITLLIIEIAWTSLATAEQPRDVISTEGWRRIDSSIDRGLEYLSNHQRADGSFEAPVTGQPGITSLAVLAFLSRGHLPGDGPYGQKLLRAIEFVQTCQRENGLLSAAEPEAQHVHDGASHTGNYNHAISGLMLTEIYGMLPEARAERVAETINLALKFTRDQHKKPKNHPGESGGGDTCGRARAGMPIFRCRLGN